MFRGLSAINIDEKGRITVPSQYRQLIVDQAAGHVVVTIDTEAPCLLLYPFPQWQNIETKLNQLPSFHPVTRRIQRLLIGHATELTLDRSGRILLPSLLRDYASIEKTAMMVGQGQKFEIWAEQLWQQSREEWLSESLDHDREVGTLPIELLDISL